MPTPNASVNFPDLLDPRFERIFTDTYKQHKSHIPTFFHDAGTNGRDSMKWSRVSGLPNFVPFSGAVVYQDHAQLYDVTLTPLEFVNGFQIERKLWDDEQFHIMDKFPATLADAAFYTREEHAARIFNNSFNVDTLFYTNTENVALCSNSHPTTTGASTSTGFDNLSTSEFSATAVEQNYIQMRQFLNPQGQRISLNPDCVVVPVPLYGTLHEILNSKGKVGTANNEVNIHEGQYRGIVWDYLNDVDNWWMCELAGLKADLEWSDRIPLEKGFTEDFDTFIGKYRAYMRYGNCWTDWRHLMGNLVA